MKTFASFCENKKTEDIVSEIALLMTELEVHPIAWLLEWSTSYPELEASLYEGIKKGNSLFYDIMEQQPYQNAGPGLWDTMKQAGSTMGSALKGVGAQFKNWFSGPGARFDMAVKAIDSLNQTIQSDPNLAQMKTVNGKNSLPQWLSQIRNTLVNQKKAVPQMQTQNTQTQFVQNMPTPANNQAAQPAQPNVGMPATGTP